MLITPPDLAWGCCIKGLWAFVSGCLAASAPTPPSRVRLYRCRTPSLPGDGTDGSVGPLCGRSWPWPGAWPATALRQLYNFFTQGRLELEHLSPAGGADGDALPAPGRTRLAGRPGAHVS